jgi:hypothetical protein
MTMTREQFLLIKLAEEATEVAQIALKTAQFGMEEKHPDLQENNKQRVHAELNDLTAIIEMLNKDHDFGFLAHHDHIKAKKIKVDKFYEYSRTLGKVQW